MEALELTPADIDAWRQRIRVSTFANYHYEMAKAFAGLDDLQNAAAAFERALAIDPGHAAAHWRLVDLLKQANFDAEARSADERAAAVNPCYQAQALNDIGWEILESGTGDAALLQQARAFFERSLALPGSPAEARHGQVLSLLAMRDYEGTLPLLPVEDGGPLPRQGELAVHYQRQADLAWSQARNLNVARRLYAEAARLDPTQFDPLYRSGLLAFIDEDLPTAQFTLMKAASLAAMPAMVLVHVGMVQLAAGDVEAARATFLETASDPGHRAIGRAFAAYADQIAGDLPEALQEYDKALEELQLHSPAFPWHRSWTLSLRGLGLQASGDLMGALDAHRKADALLSDRWIVVNMGIALDGLGRRAEADEQYLRAASLLPEFLPVENRLRPWAQPALGERLRSLGLLSGGTQGTEPKNEKPR